MNELDLKGIAPDIVCDRFSEGRWARSSVYAPREMALLIYVNGLELVTILCTPDKLNCLALGYLYAEGIITGMEDIAMIRVCDAESEVDVRLNDQEFALPTKRTLTSGCGGGATFTSDGINVESSLNVEPNELLVLMKQMHERMELYRLSGGVHTSALADTQNLLVMAEDIGRHNTLDKIQGECLLRKISTRDRLILTTGRISSEMLIKAARMQAPIVVSLTSPTERAIVLARELGITLVGYARGSRLSVYAHPERLGRRADGET
jgi:FdhD protein